MDAESYSGVAPPGRSWWGRGVPSAATGNPTAIPIHRIRRDVPSGHHPQHLSEPPSRAGDGGDSPKLESNATRPGNDAGIQPVAAVGVPGVHPCPEPWGSGLSLCESDPYGCRFTTARSVERALYRGGPEHSGES